MTQTNPPRRPLKTSRNLKLLLSTLSVTTALGGWAIFSLNQTSAEQAAAVDPTDTPVPTERPSATPQPTDVPKGEPRVVVIIPPLSSLPVRGLRVVGEDSVQPGPAPIVQVIQGAPQPQRGNQGGGGNAVAPQQPAAPPPAPAPRPAPVGKGHGSHP